MIEFKNPTRFMRPSDLQRLKGSATGSTHLIRYDLANDRDAQTVLDVDCPYCLAKSGNQCFTGS